jgi:small subunit ribosomal protein S1
MTNEHVEFTMESGLDAFSPIAMGSNATGKVVKIDDDTVYVDLGYKYDGQIALEEFNEGEVALGSEVTGKVVYLNDAKEKLVLSKRAIDAVHAWETLEAKMQSGEVIEAKVAEVVKGGLVVQVGVRGFVPASQVERSFIEDLSSYKGKTLRLKVKEVNKEDRKVILSQRDVLDAEYAETKKQRFAEIKEGDQVTGSVVRLTAFGAFVDLGGVEGLVHISELSWDRVKEVSSVVKVGQIVTAKVLKVDLDAGRIGLSLKAVQASPWEVAQDKLQVGAVVSGTVKRLAAFGAFVELAPGVEGLVHISQIAHQRIANPQEVLTAGQVVDVKVLEVNVAEQRISLSIKATIEAPVVDRGEQVVDEEVEAIDPALLQKEELAPTLGERFGDAFAQLQVEEEKKPVKRTRKVKTEE